MLISVAKRERVSVAKRERANASSLIVQAAALAAFRRYRQLRQRRLGRSPRKRLLRRPPMLYIAVPSAVYMGARQSQDV